MFFPRMALKSLDDDHKLLVVSNLIKRTAELKRKKPLRNKKSERFFYVQIYLLMNYFYGLRFTVFGFHHQKINAAFQIFISEI